MLQLPFKQCYSVGNAAQLAMLPLSNAACCQKGDAALQTMQFGDHQEICLTCRRVAVLQGAHVVLFIVSSA